MAAPNIASLTTITGKTYGCAVGTSRTDLIPTVAANNVIKVNALTVSNVDGVNQADATVEWYDSSTTTYFKIGNTIAVPGDASIPFKDALPIYLEEGDKLTVLASAAGDLEAIASGEVMA